MIYKLGLEDLFHLTHVVQVVARELGGQIEALPGIPGKPLKSTPCAADRFLLDGGWLLTRPKQKRTPNGGFETTDFKLGRTFVKYIAAIFHYKSTAGLRFGSLNIAW